MHLKFISKYKHRYFPENIVHTQKEEECIGRDYEQCSSNAKKTPANFDII